MPAMAAVGYSPFLMRTPVPRTHGRASGTGAAGRASRECGKRRTDALTSGWLYLICGIAAGGWAVRSHTIGGPLLLMRGRRTSGRPRTILGHEVPREGTGRRGRGAVPHRATTTA